MIATLRAKKGCSLLDEEYAKYIADASVVIKVPANTGIRATFSSASDLSLLFVLREALRTPSLDKNKIVESKSSN